MVVTMYSDLGFIGTEKKSVSMMTVERPLSNLLVGGTNGLQSLQICTMPQIYISSSKVNLCKVYVF